MNEKNIKELIVSRENIDLLSTYFINHPREIRKLMKLITDEKRSEYWRAAWIADKINARNSGLISPYLPLLYKALKSSQNNSKLRLLLKITSQHPISKQQQGFLFDICLRIFTTPVYPAAVRVHALQNLYEVSQMEPDLKHELILIIENEMELHSTAGIKSRGRSLLYKLYQELQP